MYRKLLENPIWTQLAPAVAKVGIYFLLRANYRPGQWYDGTTAVQIPAGSFITSYEKTAMACNISKQQARDAFEHLERTQFATYRRTHRWTLVTVLNWWAYQSSTEDENTVENAEETASETAHGTPNKKERSKEYTPYPLTGAGNAIPSDPAKLPFTTTLIEFGADANGQKGHGHNGHTPTVDETLDRVAREIHERHPNEHGRRDISAAGIKKKLAAILKHQGVPRSEHRSYLLKINRNHAGMCASDAWTKEGGQYAKGLDNWLAPTKERYLAEPPVITVTGLAPLRMVL